MKMFHKPFISVFIWILFLLSVSKIQAQEIKVEDRYDEYFGEKPVFTFTIRGDLNLNDASLGTTFGWKKKNFSIFTSVDARPFRKRNLYYVNSNTSYQFWQERYMIGMGVEIKRQFNEEKRLGAFAQLSPTYAWGRYAGTEKKPDHGLILIPRMGLFWSLPGDHYFKLGYAYVDTKTESIDIHRVFLAITLIPKKS